MNGFRHPSRAIREPFGTAGLIVAVSGFEYSAVQGLNGRQKMEVKKTAKEFAGKQEPAGAPSAPGGSSFTFDAEDVLEKAFCSGCQWEQENPDTKPELTVAGTLCLFEDFGEGAEFQFFKVPGDEFAGCYAAAGSYMVMERGSTPGQTFSAGAWAICGRSNSNPLPSKAAGDTTSHRRDR
jgi:hypothetical protein